MAEVDDHLSPPSRSRLVVATQALDIQHLKDVIKTREREMSDVTKKYAVEIEEAREKNKAMEAKNNRLESQVQLLGQKLREMEEQKEAQLNDEVGAMLTMSQTGKERDALIGQLREESRALRTQNASLAQEREVILEKLVVERNKVSVLESKLKELKMSPLTEGVAPKSQGFTMNRGTQTSDVTSLVDFDDASADVEQIKAMIDLEQNELSYHQDCSARHAANVEELHERMQRKLQFEVKKLQDQQDNYKKMMQSFHPTNVDVSGKLQSPLVTSALSAGDTTRREVEQSAGEVSGYTPSITNRNFFKQQESEMDNLRRRLLELQERHEEIYNTPVQKPYIPTRAFVTNGSNVSSASLGAHQDYTASSVSHRTPSAGSNSSILQRMLDNATKR